MNIDDKLIEGVTISLLYPAFWKDVPVRPFDWNLDGKAMDAAHATGYTHEVWEGGAQDSAFVTIKGGMLPDGVTYDEAIDSLRTAWYGIDIEHPWNNCWECECHTEWEMNEWVYKCRSCGTCENGESEEYLLTFEPLEYWLELDIIKRGISDWETFGPQE